MGAHSYCQRCDQALALATMEEACSHEQRCPKCSYSNRANATPAEVFEMYREETSERLERLEAALRHLTTESSS